jgi:hypothetical protein
MDEDRREHTWFARDRARNRRNLDEVRTSAGDEDNTTTFHGAVSVQAFGHFANTRCGDWSTNLCLACFGPKSRHSRAPGAAQTRDRIGRARAGVTSQEDKCANVSCAALTSFSGLKRKTDLGET